jgi:hypothetical protein
MTAIAAFLVGLFSNTTISQSTPLQSLGDQTSINLEYLKLWVTIPAMLITFTGMSILSFLHNSEVLLQQGDDATQELKYSLNPEYSSVPPQLVKLKAYVDRNSNTDTTKETQLMRLGRILLSVGKSPTTLEVIIDVTTLAAVPLLLGDMANLTTLERMGVALAVGTTSGTITTAATAFVKAQTAKLTRLAEASLSAAYNSSTSSVYNAAQDTGHMSTGILKCVSTFFYRCMWGHQNSENVPLVASTSHPQEPKPTQSYSSIQ